MKALATSYRFRNGLLRINPSFTCTKSEHFPFVILPSQLRACKPSSIPVNKSASWCCPSLYPIASRGQSSMAVAETRSIASRRPPTCCSAGVQSSYQDSSLTNFELCSGVCLHHHSGSCHDHRERAPPNICAVFWSKRPRPITLVPDPVRVSQRLLLKMDQKLVTK